MMSLSYAKFFCKDTIKMTYDNGIVSFCRSKCILLRKKANDFNKKM